MNTAAIAQHLNVAEAAIVEIQEWARVLWVRVKGLGARFVSKKVTKMETVGEYQLPEALEIREDKVFCKDCGRWEYVSKVESGAKIRHSSRCDFVDAQPKKPVQKPVKRSKLDELAKAAQDHRDGYNVDSDTVYDAYKAGYLSMSDAMNSDF